MEKDTEYTPSALELLGKKIREQNDTMHNLEIKASTMTQTVQTICEMVHNAEKAMTKQQTETEALTGLIIEMGIEAAVLDNDITTLDITAASMVILKVTDSFRGGD